MWNNNNPNDLLNHNSITIKSILSSFNLFNVKNDNSEFTIKNSGEINIKSNEKINIKSNEKININDSIEVDNNVTIKTNLVISENIKINKDSTGIEGQINYIGNKLYIYLGNSWKEIKLA